MKRLDTHQTKDFRPLVIMGSELSRVIETLAPCKDIRIVADDIEFESIEEFISESRGKAPRVMKISAREPYLTIDFYPSSARLYVSSSVQAFSPSLCRRSRKVKDGLASCIVFGTS